MDISFIMARYRHHHHYRHKTAAGNILFWSGALLVGVEAYWLKYRKNSDSNKALKAIVGGIGFVLIILSYVIDLFLA